MGQCRGDSDTIVDIVTTVDIVENYVNKAIVATAGPHLRETECVSLGS